VYVTYIIMKTGSWNARYSYKILDIFFLFNIIIIMAIWTNILSFTIYYNMAIASVILKHS